MPRRTRRGWTVIGPSPLSRWWPAARYGIPLTAVLFSVVLGAALHRAWQWSFPGALPAAYLIAAVLLWTALSAALLLVLALTHPTVLLEEKHGMLRRRRGLMPVGCPVPIDRLLWSGVDAQDPSIAMLVLAGEARAADVGADRAEDSPKTAVEHWLVPHITWDEPGYEGLRALQRRVDAPLLPSRTELRRSALRTRIRATDQQLAARYAMPWRPEHEDHERFLADFDARRRELAAAQGRARRPRARQESGA